MNPLKLCSALLLMTAAIAVNGQGETNLQPSRHENTAWVELGGPGGFYSLNYQHNFNISKKIAFAAGAYVMPCLPKIRKDASQVMSVGGQLQALYRIGSNEFGVGTAFSVFRYDERIEGIKPGKNYITFGQLTYGHVFHNNFYGGIAFTPVLTINGESEITPWGGLRFGYRFR